MHRLYLMFVRSALEYVPIVWNVIASSDANKLERVKQRFVDLNFDLSFLQIYCKCSFVLEDLNVDALFLIQI
jgi:hypothetical protein